MYLKTTQSDRFLETKRSLLIDASGIPLEIFSGRVDKRHFVIYHW